MSVSSASGIVLRRAILTSRGATQRPSVVESLPRSINSRVFGSYRTIHRSARLPAITASEARHRPTLRPHQQSSAARVIGPSAASKRSIFIQTENTPNPDALKFIPNHRILPEGFPTSFLEYLSPRSTLAPPHPSPLAANLLNVDGVTSVFYGPEFITVTKASDANWAHIKPEVFSLITQSVTSGEPIVSTVAKSGEQAQEGGDAESLSSNEEDDEVVGMIKELLETRIRPAIQEDGGDIEFRGFENGIVMLKLRGACRTCDSSTVTLKNGIESMLMHYIEEVQGVEQAMDEEEEISMHEFAKFEEKLRQQKGAAATASTGGKGTLDSAA
ncbi:scaffold protein Nfu/NifU N terminal-domain-containing protein [Aspergillus avenaceus]|uniref:Scaffold protein Nfu/NifU N terminal-domain-containing protein n=1 Tax=Aspergillus avenaceus TaxID=36643 RepID=A0A5N6TDU5_ASPAV|nr:scaffold protein Nfu/NifU N terminal-domain-containing protein [Aspergillus avenaceus]